MKYNHSPVCQCTQRRNVTKYKIFEIEAKVSFVDGRMLSISFFYSSLSVISCTSSMIIDQH